MSYYATIADQVRRLDAGSHPRQKPGTRGVHTMYHHTRAAIKSSAWQGSPARLAGTRCLHWAGRSDEQAALRPCLPCSELACPACPLQLTNCTKAAICDPRFEEQANSTVAIVVHRKTNDPESESGVGWGGVGVGEQLSRGWQNAGTNEATAPSPACKQQGRGQHAGACGMLFNRWLATATLPCLHPQMETSPLAPAPARC